MISLPFFGVLFFDGIHHRLFLFLVLGCFCPCGQKTFLFDLFLIFDLPPALLLFIQWSQTEATFGEAVVGCLYRKVGREKA